MDDDTAYHYLKCTAQSEQTSPPENIGSDGGIVRGSHHHFRVPRDAYQSAQPMTLARVGGELRGFRTTRQGNDQPDQPFLIQIVMHNCSNAQKNARRWSIFRFDNKPNPNQPKIGKRLVTGRMADTLWAIAPGNSFFIVAD
jgi:hypothetical protein